MFSWVDLLKLWSRNTAPAHHDGALPSIRLLVITSSDPFYTAFVDIASNAGWEIRRASTVQEGVDAVHSYSMPLILFDWDENGEDWRQGVRRLAAVPNPPCILLASRCIDDNLRQEVLRFRGYDVLAKSADREQIVRSIEFAWFWITRSQRFAGYASQEEARH